MDDSKLLYQQKQAYEEFTKSVVASKYFQQLVRNNKAYRHVLRFGLHGVLFLLFSVGIYWVFISDHVLAFILYPVYLFFQGLLIAGFMLHSHELSHNQIKSKLLNDFIGIVSGSLSFINFYSFRYAHKLHHKNIGNIDTIEAGAPISLTGQKKIRDNDVLHRTGLRIFNFSKLIWFMVSWPLFIYHGDYSSWLLPFTKHHQINYKSLFVFIAILLANCMMLFSFPIVYLLLYLIPVLIGGNRILVITSMHHAHEDTMFFSEKEHNFYNTIMSTTDRDFGVIVNFFMMNNGYHIAHHMSAQIAYYDLKKASRYLREKTPQDLAYNFYPKSRFYRDFMHSYYEKRLDKDYQYYQIKYL